MDRLVKCMLDRISIELYILNDSDRADSVAVIQKEQIMKKSLAPTVWECKCHMVWGPTNRRKIVYAGCKEKLGRC